MPFKFFLALRTKFWYSMILSTNYRLIRPIYFSIKIGKRIMCLEYMFCTSLEHQIVLPDWEQSCVLSTNKSRTRDVLSTVLLLVSEKEKKMTLLTFYNLNRKADKLKFQTCDWFNESQKKSKMSKFCSGSLKSQKTPK